MSNNLWFFLPLKINNNFLLILLIILVISRFFLFSFRNPPDSVFPSSVCICPFIVDFFSDIAFPLSRIHCRPVFPCTALFCGIRNTASALPPSPGSFPRNEYTWNQLIFFCFCPFTGYICLYIENNRYFYSFIFCIFCILIPSDSVYFLLIFIYS